MGPGSEQMTFYLPQWLQLPRWPGSQDSPARERESALTECLSSLNA